MQVREQAFPESSNPSNVAGAGQSILVSAGDVVFMAGLRYRFHRDAAKEDLRILNIDGFADDRKLSAQWQMLR
jgi:hypothetical protein